MQTFDGLKLLVKFYSNHGALKQVAESSGVELVRLRGWLDDKFELTDEEREKLIESAEEGEGS